MSIRSDMKSGMERYRRRGLIKKEQQVYQHMLRGTDYRGTEVVFNQRTLAWLVVVVTVFLQLISLATTFEGSKVYFGGVALPFGLSAPLLFALSIQLIVFCMSHTIRKQFKAWLVMILVMATLCSTYFSYIGIYNHINSPVDYLEERYKQIYGKMTEQYQLVIDQADNNMKEYVFDLVGEVTKGHTGLVKQVAEYGELSKKLDGIKVDTGKINPQTSALKKPNINSYGDNLSAYYEDMAKYNAALGTMITDTTKQDSDLKNQLYENEVKAVLGGKTREEFMSESIAASTNKEQMEKLVAAMYALVSPEGKQADFDEQMMAIQQYCLDFVGFGTGDEEIFSTVLTNLYTQVTRLGESAGLEHFKSDLNYFMTLSQKDEVAMKSLDEIKNEVYKQTNGVEAPSADLRVSEDDAMLLYTHMQSEIKSIAYMLNQIEGLEKKVDLNDETYLLHNLYVLPIMNLIGQSESRAMAWFCLAFAVLIDGLTLLFALMEGREKTPLFAKSNKDIVGKSKEAIEELMMSTIMATNNNQQEGTKIDNALGQLERFMNHFKLVPEGLESGYSMCAPLSQLEEYSAFVAVLCQFNLAAILSKDEMLEGMIGDEDEERYVLIKTKVVIWANQKIADLGLKQEYIHEVEKIEELYQEETRANKSQDSEQEYVGEEVII